MAAQDISAAKTDFWIEVDRFAPDLVSPMKPVLDDLIAWSDQYRDVLFFRWHEGESGRQRQSLVKYVVTGADSPFWAVWPRGKDGAKLTILTDECPVFTEELRAEARQAVASIGKYDPGDAVEIALQALIPGKKREEVKALMSHMLAQVTRKS